MEQFFSSSSVSFGTLVPLSHVYCTARVTHEWPQPCFQHLEVALGGAEERTPLQALSLKQTLWSQSTPCIG